MNNDFPGQVHFLDFTKAMPLQFDYNGNPSKIYEYKNTFDCIVIDPPFDNVSIEQVFIAINFLYDYNSNGKVLMTHQTIRKPYVERIALRYGFKTELIDTIPINYRNPPGSHINGKNPIGLFEFTTLE